jgi:bacterioferritin (cytochrome b1)
LLQLTSSEAQTAEIRVSQARTDAVRRELQQNASNAEKRAEAIARDLRRLGGVPDVVTPAVGRFVAFAKSGADQAQPLPEALFGDLALEHQLLDRARYVKVLAKELDEKRTVQLAERLEKAHTATVEWLTTVLAEEALGGPAALQATPLQTVAGGAYRVAILPGRFALTQFNRAADRVSQSADVVRSRVLGLKGKAEDLGDKATQFSESAADVVKTGVNAGLRTSESRARANSQTAGDNIHEARRKAGALDADELPIKGYGDLSANAAAEAIKGLDKAEDIRTVVRHEEAHKNRSSVVSAAQTTLARLAKEAVNS